MDSESRLLLTMSAGKVADFLQVMQGGFGLKGDVGCSVWAFLSQQLGLSASIVEERISTIFLDGKPVDDIHGAKIKDGSVLALSGAMPGLLGATMRRAGFYAALRRQISHRSEESDVCASEGMVTLKLFNVIAADLGKRILRHGVWVSKGDLADFIQSRPSSFWSGCEIIELDGKVIDEEKLRHWSGEGGAEMVNLSVHLGLEGEERRTE